jgi:hypothetical protein
MPYGTAKTNEKQCDPLPAIWARGLATIDHPSISED